MRYSERVIRDESLRLLTGDICWSVAIVPVQAVFGKAGLRHKPRGFANLFRVVAICVGKDPVKYFVIADSTY
jgi:hypothetical protein